MCIFRVYNEVTPKVELSGPTNFAPLIYEAMKICQRIQDVSYFLLSDIWINDIRIL